MSQPVIDYSISWGPYNIYSTLSGKTYTDLYGRTVDCSYVDITYSSIEDFTQFYATAVKDGNNYGFVNNILVDIHGTSPTGVELHAQSNGKANTDYTFRVNASTFTGGDGVYRIGLYMQKADGTWNYEYLFIPVGSDSFQLSGNKNLQVSVITS